MNKNRLFISEGMPYAHTHTHSFSYTHTHTRTHSEWCYTNGERRRKKNCFLSVVLSQFTDLHDDWSSPIDISTPTHSWNSNVKENCISSSSVMSMQWNSHDQLEQNREAKQIKKKDVSPLVNRCKIAFKLDKWRKEENNIQTEEFQMEYQTDWVGKMSSEIKKNREKMHMKNSKENYLKAKMKMHRNTQTLTLCAHISRVMYAIEFEYIQSISASSSSYLCIETEKWIAHIFFLRFWFCSWFVHTHITNWFFSPIEHTNGEKEDKQII